MTHLDKSGWSPARIGEHLRIEYHWGDFRGDPSQMMERYYDAHLYLANWENGTNDPRELAEWITDLPLIEKDRLLLRAVRDHPATVRTELLRCFREQSTPALPSAPRRTVADLLDTAARTRAERERRAAAHRGVHGQTGR